MQSFPEPGGKLQVSTAGGLQPVWSRDGRELYFRSSDALMTARVVGRAPLTLGVPEALFRDPYLRPQGEGHTTYDVFPDGSFLFIEGEGVRVTAPTVIAVFNWIEEVK